MNLAICAEYEKNQVPLDLSAYVLQMDSFYYYGMYGK